jgi:hypothetical protein
LARGVASGGLLLDHLTDNSRPRLLLRRLRVRILGVRTTAEQRTTAAERQH